MLTMLRKRLTYTNIMLTLALVFAMTGGAYAASKVLITSTKQISPKVLASLKGAKGKNGDTGPAGAPGAQGPQGAAGTAGTAGTKGTNGIDGKEGPQGKEGPEGSPGPSCNASGECLLPAGATETGTWSYSGGAVKFPFANISFPLRLTSTPEFEWVSAANSGTPGAVSGCPGTVGEPKAEAGKVCVYAKELKNSEPFTPQVNLLYDGGIAFSFEATNSENETWGFGSWAVNR